MEAPTDKRLFTQQGIAIATFFGGPLAAGYLIRHNFKVLSKEREGLIAIILGILTTLVVLVPFFILPEKAIPKLPNYVIPVIYTTIAFVSVEWTQGKDIKDYNEAQRPFASNWKAAGIGLLWTLVYVGALLGYIFATTGLNVGLDKATSEKLEQVAVNEEKALKFYQLDPNTTTKEAYLKALKEEGIVYWDQNLKLLQEVQQVDMDEAYTQYVEKLLTYTQLRQEVYLLMMQSISDSTEQYEAEIAQKNEAISNVLEELEQLMM